MRGRWSARQLDRLAAPALNVGRWGPDDELRTLNFVTPAVRLAALGLVQEIDVVPLGKELTLERSRHRPPSAALLMTAGDPPEPPLRILSSSAGTATR